MAADLIVARIVHILSAAVWVGGTVFLVAVAVPFARTFPPQRRTEVAAAIGRRFRPVAWTALAGLVASGLYTMQRFGLFSGTRLTAPGYGTMLLVKLAFVVVLIALSALHDFVLGPRAEVAHNGGRRGLLLTLARINGVLTLVIPVIGVLLAH